jgi:thioredoxin-dependent adenylylsulfate APS reductase
MTRASASVAEASPGLDPSPPQGTWALDDLEDGDARTVLSTALETIGATRLPLVTSLAPEGIVILDMLTRLVSHPRVITIDTGRLPVETLDLIERVRHRFGIDIEVIHPDQADVDEMVRVRGVDLFYRSREDRVRCCEVRKVLPLRRVLAGAGGWITGLRRDQSATRAATPKVARDLAHGSIWKIAPLADWSSGQVWAYIQARDLPYNTLHDDDYQSIGCAPCTKPVAPGADARSGRWWWEAQDTVRECGIHSSPLASTSKGSG